MDKEIKQEKDSNWKVQTSTDWKVRIPRELYDKIFMYTKLVDTEIAGFGDVKVDKEKKEYVITKLRMYKQKVSGASVDQDEKALGDMIVQALDSKEDLSAIKFEWHSHANMGVFWSGTDDECCKMLVNCSKDFYIFFVVNKKGELLSRIDYLFQMPNHSVQLTNYCIPVIVEYPDEAGLEASVKADIEKYVEQSQSIIVTGPVSNADSFRSHYYADYECDLCKQGTKKTRWHSPTNTWICEDCFASKARRSISKGMVMCENCEEEKYGKWHESKWLCYTCLRREKIDEQLQLDKQNTFQDDRGRHWFWGVCEECASTSGTQYEEYVTNVKDLKKTMCEQCYEDYETNKKEGGLLCQGEI